MENLSIYQGNISHHRFNPMKHSFCYPIFMVYVDLDKLENINKQKLWSFEKKNLGCFRNKDYGDGTKKLLIHQIKEFIKEKTDDYYDGKIFLLTHLRYFGILFNPLSLYYCFDKSGQTLNYVVAEVTNTPWLEKHRYLLKPALKENGLHSSTEKSLHVSPFMPMDLNYDFKYNIPKSELKFSMFLSEKNSDKKIIFSAQLDLIIKNLSKNQTDLYILKYPWMTLKVIFLIYWQAMKLKIKGLKFYFHPRKIHKIK